MTTLKTVQRTALQQLLTYYQNEQQAQDVFWQLITWATQTSKTGLILKADMPLTPDAATRFEQALDEHITQHKPIQYIIGTVDFINLTLKITPPILIPRPETEWWTDKLINHLKTVIQDKPSIQAEPFTVIDLCMGSGCIGLSIAHALPVQVDLVDINPAAVALANENALAHQLTNTTIYHSNLFDRIPLNNRYTIITANPPYIRYADWVKLDPSVKQWEDALALTAEHEGLAIIQALIIQAPNWLKQSSTIPSELWLELDPWQTDYTTKLLEQVGFCSITVHKDQYGKERVVQAVWK